MLMLKQLRWAGHVSRMDASRLPKVIFCGELKQGKPDRGAPKKHFKDQLKRQLSLAKIEHSEWEQVAADRALWRATTKEAAWQFEEESWQQIPNAREESKYLHNPRNSQHRTKSSSARDVPGRADPGLDFTVIAEHAIAIGLLPIDLRI